MATPSRRDFLKLSGTALLATALGLPLAADPGAEGAPVVYHGSRLLPQIAMTYDDCWHPDVLEELTSLVHPYPDFHFTFFAIGDAIEINEKLNPGIWQRLVQAGHEIGYHTYHHVDPQVMSTKNLLADFDQWTIELNQVLGSHAAVHFARPPYDSLSQSFLELCKERGLVATLYSAGFEALEMAESMRLVSKAVNGDVVQMHTYQDPPNGRFDVDISAKAVPYLAQSGFTLVSMSELYAELLREENSSPGCNTGTGGSPTRTCLD